MVGKNVRTQILEVWQFCSDWNRPPSGSQKFVADGTDLPGFLGKIYSDTARDLPPNFQGSYRPFPKIHIYVGAK